VRIGEARKKKIVSLGTEREKAKGKNAAQSKQKHKDKREKCGKRREG